MYEVVGEGVLFFHGRLVLFAAGCDADGRCKQRYYLPVHGGNFLKYTTICAHGRPFTRNPGPQKENVLFPTI